MDAAQKGNRKNIVNPEQKYIRIQIAGMSIFLSGPVAMQLATYYGLNYIIPQISALLFVIALIVFFIGLVGKQELKERAKEK